MHVPTMIIRNPKKCFIALQLRDVANETHALTHNHTYTHTCTAILPLKTLVSLRVISVDLDAFGLLWVPH